MYFPRKLYPAAICVLVIAAMFVTVPFVTFAHENENIPTPTGESQILYLDPNENWLADDAWFVLYYFDYNDHYDCVPMTDEDGDGVYEAVLPDGYPNFLFYRMDATVTEFNGDYVLHQTDVFEYAENTQCYALAEDSWEAGNWEAAPAIVNVADHTAEETASEKQPNIDETASVETENKITDTTVTEGQTNTEHPTSAETATDILADDTEATDPQIETNIFYLSLEQVDQEFTWKIKTSEADYDVTEETEAIYSVELPVDTESMIIHGENEDSQIASAEISLIDIHDNNCIVARACEDDVTEFEIMWGVYHPETEEITFEVEENLVSIEEKVGAATATGATEPLGGSATEETESTKETKSEESIVGEEDENPENTDVVS